MITAYETSTPALQPQLLTDLPNRQLAELHKLAEKTASVRQSAHDVLKRADTLIKDINAYDDHSSCNDVETYQHHLQTLYVAEREVIIEGGAHQALKMRIDFVKLQTDQILKNPRLDTSLRQQLQHSAQQLKNDFQTHVPAITDRRSHLLHQIDALARQLEERAVVLSGTARGGPAFAPVNYISRSPDPDWEPQFLTPHYPVSEHMKRYVLSLKYAIRSAVSGLLLESQAENDRVHYASCFNFVYGKPGLGEPYAVVVPLSSLMPLEGKDWELLADEQTQISVPFRLGTGMTNLRDGQLNYGIRQIKEQAHLYVYPTKRNPALSTVKIRRAVKNAESGDYQFLQPSFPGHSITWKGRLASTDVEPTQPQKQSMYPSSLRTVDVPVIETLNSAEDIHCDDCIVVFPDGAGIDPVYVVFKSVDEYPGAAFGAGQPAGDDWLSSGFATSRATIPASVASQLNGKTFKRFDLFTQAFWKALVNTPNLAAQFSDDALISMKSGIAPVVAISEVSSEKAKLTLKHVLSISDGGAVYDMDNMQISITPLAA